MPLWGKTNTASAKPKYLSYKDAGDVYADARGWIKAVRNSDGSTKSEEVLVAISQLSTDIAAATPTAIYFDKAAYDSNDVVILTIEYDEELQFTGTVSNTTLTAVGVTLGGSAQAFAYASGLDANKEGNKLTFTSTLAGTGSLVIPAVTVTLSGALSGVKDNTDSTVTPDLVTATTENKGAGGSGDYAAITVTAAS